MPRGWEMNLRNADSDQQKKKRIYLKQLLQDRIDQISSRSERRSDGMANRNACRRLVMQFPFWVGLYEDPACLASLIDEVPQISEPAKQPPQVVLLQVSVPREPESSKQKESVGNTGTLACDLSDVNSEFLASTFASTGNSGKPNRKKKNKKKGKHNKNRAHRKLSESECTTCMNSTSSNAESPELGPPCSSPTSVLPEGTSSTDSLAQKNSEDSLNCKYLDEDFDRSVGLVSFAPCSREIVKSESALDVFCGKLSQNEATNMSNAATDTQSPNLLYSLQMEGRNALTAVSSDCCSSCSVSENSADAVLDLSLDEWSSDISGQSTTRNEMRGSNVVLKLSLFEDSDQTETVCSNEQSKHFSYSDFCSPSPGANEVECIGDSSGKFHLVTSGRKGGRRRKICAMQNDATGAAEMYHRNNCGNSLSQKMNQVDRRGSCQPSRIQNSRIVSYGDSSYKQSPSDHLSYRRGNWKQRVPVSPVAGGKDSDRMHVKTSTNTRSYMGTRNCRMTNTRHRNSTNVRKNIASHSCSSSAVTHSSYDDVESSHEPISLRHLADMGSTFQAGSRGSLVSTTSSVDLSLPKTELKGHKVVATSSMLSDLPCIKIASYTKISCIKAGRSTEDGSQDFCAQLNHENFVRRDFDVEFVDSSSCIQSTSSDCTEDVNSRICRSDNDTTSYIKSAVYDMVPDTMGWQDVKIRGVHRTHLDKITRAVNDAYAMHSALDGIRLVTGQPTADVEEFMCSASPAVCGIPCSSICDACNKEQVVNLPVCWHKVSNFSLKCIWEWYEEPGCYGLKVNASDRSKSILGDSQFKSSAYFVPYLSAVQLFSSRQSSADASLLSISTSTLKENCKHTDVEFLEQLSGAEEHEELIFEYFETEQPSMRCSLYEKIKELIHGVQSLDSRVYGDPKMLQDAKLHDLHPASWFSVAWYPIYRIPRGNFRASFLTYHSLGKLCGQQGCSFDKVSEPSGVVFPVVGLLSYNDKGEQWFQLEEPASDRAGGVKCSQLLEERLKKLKHTASVMSRPDIPIGGSEGSTQHPDYEFFLSRAQ